MKKKVNVRQLLQKVLDFEIVFLRNALTLITSSNSLHTNCRVYFDLFAKELDPQSLHKYSAWKQRALEMDQWPWVKMSSVYFI